MAVYSNVRIPKVVKKKDLLKALESIGFKEILGTKHHKLKDLSGRIATVTRSKNELEGSYVRIVLQQICATQQEADKIIGML